ncbi:MAG: hypothetical protein M5U17_11585 [Ignavibacterium sp.]|nr:hypothetical protein [Ignavibacterium sp.]
MKPKSFFLLFLTLLIVNSSLLIATVRYVSKTGSSTPPYTNWQTAADSIQKCINLCVDGDTIYVANGVYKENLVINTAISLIGSSMDSTVIDGRGMADYSINIKRDATIENFNLFGKAYGMGICIYSVSSNFPVITVRNCNIREAAGGIASYGLNAENVILKKLHGGINPAGLPNSNNLISNCNILVEGDYATGISLGGPTYANYEINNNIILFSGSANPDNGISIGAPRRVIIKNNLISGFADNIFIDSVPDTVFIKNNILCYHTYGLGSISTSGNRVITNSLILSNNGTGIKHSGSGFVRSNYNMYWKNQRNLQGVTMGDSDIVADPMFVNDTIPTANSVYDFHLQAYSPAIDKGDPNILDLDGSRSDIGMYGGPFGETYTYQDLAPLAPRNLSAVVDSSTILVKWKRNTEADTAFYKVYRDTVSGFTIDSTKLVSSSSDSFFVQANPNINIRYVYKITCVDNQGNESQPSTELVVNVTDVEDYPQLTTNYLLYQNYPNPFNPSTKIGYQLKERAYVKLMVYDIKGELVSVLVNKEQNAGYYEVDFSVGNHQSSAGNSIASGIYLYRIEVIGEGRIPVYTEMKKMILIK